MELSFPRMWALVRNDLRILRSDPAFVLIFTIMPLAFMAFTKGAFGASLAVQYPGRGLTGAEQVVPGAAVMFSGFMVGNLGFGIFREHSWATWDRLRASQLGTAEIMIAKGVTPMLVLILQMTVMLGAGALLFDLHLAGSVPAFVLVALALALMELTLGFALLALCRSVLQINAATNVGAMLLAGVGGAITPVELLPGWAQAMAPFTPAYWAMRGFTAVTIDNGGIVDVAKPVLVLVAFAAAFAVISALKFRTEDAKIGWA